MLSRWYVAKLKPHSEHKVAQHLARYGVEVFAPDIVVQKRVTLSQEPLFPGYIFVCCDPSSDKWALIRWAHGLSYFLPVNSEPLPVPEAILYDIKARTERWNAGGWRGAFRPGEQVMISAGHLTSVEGIFQRYVPGKQRCEVLIHLMGRLQTVQVDIEALYIPNIKQRFAAVT